MWLNAREKTLQIISGGNLTVIKDKIQKSEGEKRVMESCEMLGATSNVCEIVS